MMINLEKYMEEQIETIENNVEMMYGEEIENYVSRFVDTLDDYINEDGYELDEVYLEYAISESTDDESVTSEWFLNLLLNDTEFCVSKVRDSLWENELGFFDLKSVAESVLEKQIDDALAYAHPWILNYLVAGYLQTEGFVEVKEDFMEFMIREAEDTKWMHMDEYYEMAVEEYGDEEYGIK